MTARMIFPLKVAIKKCLEKQGLEEKLTAVAPLEEAEKHQLVMEGFRRRAAQRKNKIDSVLGRDQDPDPKSTDFAPFYYLMLR